MQSNLVSCSLAAFFALSATLAHAQQSADMLRRLDTNRDGKVTQDEFPERFRERFERMDSNGDRSVSAAEFDAFRREQRAPRQPDRRNQFPAPTHADVSYGDHPKQAFDIWLTGSRERKPAPLVIYIHGGGFRGGDKSSVRGQPVRDYLDHGVSFVSMNYRLSDVGTYPMMMQDCARALQLIRSRAKEWNLDPERIACYGGSAGAGISLWLAFHDDLADPNSSDPIARQSTRIVAAGSQNGQSTYDMRTFQEWFDVPNLRPHPALEPFYGVEEGETWQSDRVKRLMTEASPISHLTKDDPPVFMSYGRGDVPVDENSDPGLWVHHVRLGLKLQEAMEKLGLECHVSSPEHRSTRYEDIHAFLRDKVGAPRGDDDTDGNDDTASRGRLRPNGEYYAPPALEERVASPLSPGDLAPDFSLPVLDGETHIRLSQYRGEKPVVLVFGSITCGPFRQKVTEVFDLHRRYGDEAQFLMIYIREAHPESTIRFPTTDGAGELKKFEQTDLFVDRMRNAQSCTQLLDVPFPVLVDGEENATLAAYGGWPIRLVAVGKDGRIAWDGGQGPRGFQPTQLAAWLKANL